MSDTDPTSDGGQIDIKAYREAMAQAAAATKALADKDSALRKKDLELAALTAGIPTGTKPGQAFINQYEGDLDPEAMRAEAMDWGLWKPEGSQAGSNTRADQAQIEADRAALQNSGFAPDVNAEPPAQHPGVVGFKAYEARLQRGDSRQNASAEVVSRIVDAAIKGDPRVLVKPWTDDELGYA